MGCPPSREAQERMDREREAQIKRAMETGGIYCDKSAAPTRAERIMARETLSRQGSRHQGCTRNARTPPEKVDMKYIKYLLRSSAEALREAGEEDDDGYDAYISLAIEIEEFLAQED